MRYSILLSKRKEWYAFGSQFLIWADGVPFSHCAIYCHDTDKVYESVQPESREIDYNEWLKHYEVIKEFPLPDVQAGSLIWLKGMLGKRYSVTQLLVIGLGKLLKPLQKRLDFAIINDEKSLICTELVARFLVRWFTVQFSKNYDMLSLRDIYRVLWRGIE